MSIPRILLGRSGLNVSRLCFGTEPFGLRKWFGEEKRQGDKSPEEGARILKNALDLGVNFWDTSDDYHTHAHVAEALKRVRRQDVVITDKSYAMTFEKGQEAIEFSLKSLGTDYIDIMFLHFVPLESHWRYDSAKRHYESGNLESRRGTLKAFCKARETGVVKAIGLSTHSTKVLKQVLDVPEIDVVCTVLNKKGTYIEDGSMQEHLDAIRQLHESGRGVYAIKVLSAGQLRDESESALNFAFEHNSIIHAWNIGMYSLEEVTSNLRTMIDALGKYAND